MDWDETKNKFNFEATFGGETDALQAVCKAYQNDRWSNISCMCDLNWIFTWCTSDWTCILLSLLSSQSQE